MWDSMPKKITSATLGLEAKIAPTNTLIDIYGVVPIFGTEKKKIWETWQKISSQLKSNFESKG